MTDTIPWGSQGKAVYERTYSRTLPDGSKETWPQTVARVIHGNLALVYGQDEGQWPVFAMRERERLTEYMMRFAILPGGRHLWASGVKGRQYLFNCHVAGWGELLSDHFEFSFLRLMEGGGVGANYSTKHIERYGAPRRALAVQIVADEGHQDIAELRPMLSEKFSPDWAGSMPVADSREGWATALIDLIDTFMTDDLVKHPDRVYDVSYVRPSGSRLKTFGGSASGPAPFARMMHQVAGVLNNAYATGELTPLHVMEIDHAIAECVVSGGNRRSARMSIVHWNDPHIMEFLACKANPAMHWTTNISVEIDDEFFEHLSKPDSHASEVHRAVVTAMLANGEPGYWNSSLSQEGEVGTVVATNPCGEIPLEEWENCNLGAVNLDAFAPAVKGDRLDWDGLVEAHELMTRFLIRATYGDVNDDKQAAALARNRRIGVGHMGVQNFWAKLGVRYSEIPTAAGSKSMLNRLYQIVSRAAANYAFQLRIPTPVKVTCVPPGGTTPKLPGVAEGISPVYARYFERRIRFSLRDDDQFMQVDGYGKAGFVVENDQYDESNMTAVVVFPTEEVLVEQVRKLGWPDDTVESAEQIGVEAKLAMQALYQEHWADNAVSYTVNVAPGSITQDELERLLAAYLPVLKGTTLMVDDSRPQAPYTRITRERWQEAVVRMVADSMDESCATGACPVR